ncbi:hypothetical protein JCM11641_007755 [Rhodosporidiobolus odoratus]
MPELPEVEAARKRLENLAKGKKIHKVLANEDNIVFSRTTHAAFATSIEGKTVRDVRRLGKNFYLILSSPPHPLFHFGMSGMAHILGEPSPVYRVPRSSKNADWPPKYLKTCITFVEADGKAKGEVKGEGVQVLGEWAFCDPRRLGRIKLVDVEDGAEVEDVPPLSDLGADPLLNMPSLDSLRESLAKRNAPIKAVLLDQNGPFCGLGNYMVDEILFQSAIHPSHTSSALDSALTSQAPSNPSLDPLETLHKNIVYVTETAVEADADAERFPKEWLFHARWGKGKKQAAEFKLADGSTSPLSFLTVGGRTSCVVDTVQILPPHLAAKAKAKKTPRKKRSRTKDEDDKEVEDEAELEEEAMEMDEEEKKTEVTSPHFKRTKRLKLLKTELNEVNEDDDEPKPKILSSGRAKKRESGK